MDILNSTIKLNEPTILTIFGATGDLSADYLLPALLNLFENNLLSKDFHLVCVGRRNFTPKQYFAFIEKKSASVRKIKSKTRKAFLKQLTYFCGDFEDPESFKLLAKILSDKEKPKHICYNRLYYFATSPQFFASIARILNQSNLLLSCQSHNRKVRVLVEKPFGSSQHTAHSLNSLLLKYFKEDQIYRIDHYMGKETVQNLMVVRFANRLFEPLWNREFIDHVEISVLEKDSAKSRAAFYDQTGALKDVVQNHILQMLSLIAMDEPKNLETELIRNEKLKILKALRIFTAESVSINALRGQYEGYKKDVKNFESQTETFVALKLFIDSPRWRDVPFYIKTGKALNKKETKISIFFKELDKCLFRNCAANILTFRIQPDESVYLQINNKIPGFGVNLHQGLLEFGYKQAFMNKILPAYERLLLDFMEGDQRLFIRSDEIEFAWKIVDSITSLLSKIPLRVYKKGSAGPVEAEDFIKKDGRDWAK